LRRIRTSRLNAGRAAWVIMVIITALFFAWAETRLVATDKNAPFFTYEDLTWMLKYGSVFYACYFVVSFPMFYRLDEGTEDNWPLSRVCIDALATSMMVFFLLDIAMRFINR
jgi:cycloeucalenol cycloisomerase